MNPVVHFEMPYENRERMTQFYQSVFGWRTQMLGEDMGNYVLATCADSDAKPGAPAGAINGGFYARQSDCPSHPSFVIAVDDIRTAMSKVTNAGGEVVGEPMEIPGVGQFVPFVDTEGNRNSILQPSTAPEEERL